MLLLLRILQAGTTFPGTFTTTSGVQMLPARLRKLRPDFQAHCTGVYGLTVTVTDANDVLQVQR